MARKPDHSPTIILIAIFKLFKAIILVCIGIGAFHFLHRDIGDSLNHWAQSLRVDPDNRVVHALLTHSFAISPKKLELIGLGTFIYAALFGTEGIGLLLGKRWAEYMTVITTAGLMPIEVYEIVHHANALKIATLVINAAAVVYLVLRLWNTRERKEDSSAPVAKVSEPASSASG